MAHLGGIPGSSRGGREAEGWLAGRVLCGLWSSSLRSSEELPAVPWRESEAGVSLHCLPFFTTPAVNPGAPALPALAPSKRPRPESLQAETQRDQTQWTWWGLSPAGLVECVCGAYLTLLLPRDKAGTWILDDSLT